MSIQREVGSEIIAQYTTPLRGTWNSVAVHTVPTDALYDSFNVFLRRGKLRNRPGLLNLTATQFDGPILGATLAVTPYAKIVLAATKSSLYELPEQSHEWIKAIDQADSELATTDASMIDMALLETSGRYVALIASESRPLLYWDGLTHVLDDITASIGSVPKARSVCIAARRVITLTPPHTVGWSASFDFTSYPPLAIYRLAQTGDEGICIRALTSLTFAVYKERSIYTARAQAGADELAFSFNEPIRVEGPAGVRAVVDVNGAHMYMTRNGRIAIFDGSRYPQWIADGLWLFLQDDIDQLYAHMIFGVYDHRLHLVTFVYPRKGDAGKMRGLVMINMPYEGLDIQQSQPIYAAFKGQLSQSCTAGCEMRFNKTINRSVFFVNEQFDKSASIFDEEADDDNEQVFDCSMQLPLAAMPNGDHYDLNIETFFEKGQGHGFVQVQPIISHNLEDEAGTLVEHKEQVIDLDAHPLRDPYKAFSAPARFFGLIYRWTSKSFIRYAGTIIYGRKLM